MDRTIHRDSHNPLGSTRIDPQSLQNNQTNTMADDSNAKAKSTGASSPASAKVKTIIFRGARLCQSSNPVSINVCNLCGEVCTTQCSRCQSVHYCSEACQRSDWKAQKNVCNVVGSKKATPVSTKATSKKTGVKIDPRECSQLRFQLKKPVTPRKRGTSSWNRFRTNCS